MSHESELVLQTFVVAVGLGILAQVVAHRLKLPAILPLLVAGMAAGPYGLGFLSPKELGGGLETMIHLGVAVILFEGGLSLDPRQLRKVGASIRNLLVVGTLVTAVGAAALVRWATDVSWSTAALFGAIVTVTGPTVIAPLLRHTIAPRKVRTLLLSEGLMIDPIGAVLAYLVLQWIGRADLGWKALALELATLSATGAILGFVAGSVAIFAVRYRHLGDELRNLVILTVLFLTFLLAEYQSPQSGVLAAVVMGLTVSGSKAPDLNPLKAFKGQLTVLVISVLFILLSAQLDLGAMARLGWAGAAVVAGLILVVRPVSVFASVPPSQMPVKERLFAALNAPRGIVAAAVASLAAIRLRADGAGGFGDEASVLEGLVYLTILATCGWSTVMAKLLPHWLGYADDPSRRRVVLVGGNAVSKALAILFQERGWSPVVVDSVARKLSPLRQLKIHTVAGDAREAGTYEEAGVERDTSVLAVTANDELNLLVADLVREDFGVEHPVVALQQPSTEFGQLRRAWVDLLGGKSIGLARWEQLLSAGKTALITLSTQDEARVAAIRAMLKENPESFAVICGWADGKPRFGGDLKRLEEVEALTLLPFDETAHEALSELPAAASEHPANHDA